MNTADSAGIVSWLKGEVIFGCEQRLERSLQTMEGVLSAGGPHISYDNIWCGENGRPPKPVHLSALAVYERGSRIRSSDIKAFLKE